MNEQDFNEFIRNRYDSTMVNAFGQLTMTDDERLRVVNEIKQWD